MEKEFKTPEAQRLASKKYREKNKEKESYNGSFRSAKSYIKKLNDIERLNELKKLILERLELLEKTN